MRVADNVFHKIILQSQAVLVARRRRYLDHIGRGMLKKGEGDPFFRTKNSQQHSKVQSQYPTLVEAILWMLSTATSAGCSTTEIAERLLLEYKLNRFQVLRKIKGMNKRLEAEIGRPIAESREHRWVMTRYVHRILGATKEENSTAEEL